MGKPPPKPRPAIEPVTPIRTRRKPPKKPSEGPKWRGILVKDYFSLVGSFIGIFTVILTISVSSCNAQVQAQATALAAEQKLLSDQFNDVQNRLSKTDNASERVNAVNSLVDIAMRADPQFANAGDDASLAQRLELPSAWVGRLYVKSIIRPCERAYPFFKPVTVRLASVVLLDRDATVRDAAVRACGTLSSFARKEIEGLTWEDFERLPPDVTALPMTKYLVESMAQANRDAYSQWIREFGGFVGVAQVLMDAETGSAAVPDYAQGTAKWEANLTARRTIRSDNI